MFEVRVSLPSISIADTSHATSEAAVVPSFVQRHELSDCVFFLQNRFIGYVAGELRSGKSFIQANESTNCSVEAAEVASRRCALYPLFRCSVVPEEKMPEMLVAPPALERSGAWFHHGYESTHPPEPLLNALLHSDCTAKVPVDKAMSAAAPCPEEIQAHLSPFSAPLESSHPPFGNWSVIVSAIS